MVPPSATVLTPTTTTALAPRGISPRRVFATMPTTTFAASYIDAMQVDVLRHMNLTVLRFS